MKSRDGTQVEAAAAAAAAAGRGREGGARKEQFSENRALPPLGKKNKK